MSAAQCVAPHDVTPSLASGVFVRKGPGDLPLYTMQMISCKAEFLVDEETLEASIVTASETVPCARLLPALTTVRKVRACEADACTKTEVHDAQVTVASAAELAMRKRALLAGEPKPEPLMLMSRLKPAGPLWLPGSEDTTAASNVRASERLAAASPTVMMMLLDGHAAVRLKRVAITVAESHAVVCAADPDARQLAVWVTMCASTVGMRTRIVCLVVWLTCPGAKTFKLVFAPVLCTKECISVVKACVIVPAVWASVSDAELVEILVQALEQCMALSEAHKLASQAELPILVPADSQEQLKALLPTNIVRCAERACAEE